MEKRFALLVDTKEDLLEIEEGMQILWNAKIAGNINCSTVDIGSIFDDPKEFYFALSRYVQVSIDAVIVVSRCNSAKIALSIFRNEYKNQKIMVIPVILGQPNSSPSLTFENIVRGILPEMEESEFIKAKRLSFHEAMNLFPKK